MANMIKKTIATYGLKGLSLGAGVIAALTSVGVIPDSQLKKWLAVGAVLMYLQSFVKNEVLPDLEQPE